MGWTDVPARLANGQGGIFIFYRGIGARQVGIRLGHVRDILLNRLLAYLSLHNRLIL